MNGVCAQSLHVLYIFIILLHTEPVVSIVYVRYTRTARMKWRVDRAVAPHSIYDIHADRCMHTNNTQHVYRAASTIIGTRRTVVYRIYSKQLATTRTVPVSQPSAVWCVCVCACALVQVSTQATTSATATTTTSKHISSFERINL